MNKLLLFCFSLFFAPSLFAQLPNGSICPDFTGVDINQNTHRLYDYLDQGKMVFIDVSTTWCSPCWGFHQSHVLDSIYNLYGPNGTDEVRVLWIEADATTDSLDLLGQTPNSQGNWVAGTPYPMINDVADTSTSINFDTKIGNALKVIGFPTLYLVCPNRTVTEIPYNGNWGHADIVTHARNCEAPRQGIDAVFKDYLGDTVYCDGTLEPIIRVQNMGTSTITSGNILTYVNGSLVNTDSWTGSLASYQLEEIQPSPVTGLTGNPMIRFEFATTGDVDTSNDTLGIVTTGTNYTSSQKVIVEIKPDAHPNEISWELSTTSGTILKSVGLGTYSDSTLKVDTINLGNTPDCFKFTIRDVYGDGICCGQGSGYYKVKDFNGNSIVFSGGQYASEEYKVFKTNVITGIDDGLAQLDAPLVYPSITEGIVNIELPQDWQKGARLQVFDHLGRIIYRHDFADEHTLRLDLTNQTSGLYHFRFIQGDTQMVKKVVLN